ncbi:MAG: energy-coupling factor transporter ATPase [Clostridiaceae bacterium]|nr:energy-coupling factor transporter ATPase [Clostridiaceae bacterium]
METFISLEKVHYSYQQSGREPLLAVQDVSLTIPKGSHVAILGRNGSGKSTLARLINALEQPTEGTILVSGMSTAEEGNIWEIRRLCGMVFQNPDNQIIGTTVEEDVAFGPENLGFPQAKIRKSVDDALEYVGLTEVAQKPPHLLSGGQKQKLAIAGILAMKPSCLIMDEATSMLDPISRTEFMNLVQDLIRREGLTVINITHNMEEVLLADQVYVMTGGQIVVSGTPAEVFDQVELIKQKGLDVPTHTDIVHVLAEKLQQTLKPMEASSWDDARQAVKRLIETARQENKREMPVCPTYDSEPVSIPEQENKKPDEIVISIRDLSFTYTPGTILSSQALQHVSFDVRAGEMLGIIGHSGSGKSTLIQHLNGLLRGAKGQVTVLGMDASTGADVRKIRQKVGLLFQYPEHQLFEETVFQDIAFGPRRMGLDMNQIERRVLKAAHIVGLQNDELERSPFELSGGQKRRAAIAGILAMEPDILILDEPAAGLDPAGRDEILGYADRLRQMGVTVILVSHSMEDVARLADRVLVLKQGKVQAFGTPKEVFADEAVLAEAGLSLPRTTAFLRSLKTWLPDLDCDCYTPEVAANHIIAAALPSGGCEKAGEAHA